MTFNEYEKELVYGLLCEGEENGLHTKDITSLTGISNRYVRLIIQQLREDGYPICSSSRDGYWIAKSSFDLKSCLHRFQEHLNGVQVTVMALSYTLKEMESKENNENREMLV